MAINLKKITSIVPADQSILNIERLLIRAGASDIMKEYTPQAGIVAAISFKLTPPKGDSLSFRLPAKIDAMIEIFKKPKKQPLTPKQLETLQAQAIRTAWKNVHEWVHLQLTMVELQQMEMEEVFLPHMMISPTQTVFEKFKESKFKALN